MMVEKNISVVIPLFNEEESLPELHEWIVKVMNEHSFTYEVIFINDGSSDSSWKVIETIAAKDANVKGISFQRNYGKSAALHMGFQESVGEVVITMDADLQDSPDEIPDLYRMIVEDGYELVSGWKKKRYDPLSKTIPTKLFNGATRWVSKVKLNDFNCGLKAYRSDVVKSIHVYGEMHRYIPVIAKWAGFSKIGEKVVEHRARKYGETKFGLERFVNGLLDLMSITFVSKFRTRPMHFFGSMGMISFLLGVGTAAWLIIEKLIGLSHKIAVREVTDQPLFYLSLVALICGVQLFLAGFIGEMVHLNSRKGDYLVRKTVNIN